MSDLKLKKIPLNKLHLDKQNPRLPKSLYSRDEEEIITYLISTASITELMLSMCENGYFSSEPLITIPKNKNCLDDGYIVIGGNRRVTALKLLLNPKLAKLQKNKIKSIISNAYCRKIETIPSLIANNRYEVQQHLGFKHITGMKNWKSLEKARYLHQLKTYLLNKNNQLTLIQLSKELSSMIGSRSDYVKRVIVAYSVYLFIEDNDFFKIEGLDDTTFYFTNLVDSLNRRQLSEFLCIDFSKDDSLEYYHVDNPDLKHLKEWCSWLFEKMNENQTRVKGESDQLTMLASVVANEKSLEEFRGGKPLKEAAFSTEHADKVFSESIAKSIDYLKYAFSTTYNIDDFPPSLDDDLKEIVKICRSINSIKDSREKDTYEL